MFNTKITRSCDDVVENASSPSPCRIRTVPVDPYRLVSPSRWFQIHDSARGCTGRDRNLLSPSPRVAPLSVLFVAAVQSYPRQCGVLRCPNRRKAIRNHALNRRRFRLETTSKQRFLMIAHFCLPPVCRADHRSDRVFPGTLVYLSDLRTT